MIISHYIQLVEHEGEQFNRKMIIGESLERLVPVMMMALTAIFAPLPLVFSRMHLVRRYFTRWQL